MGPTPSAGLTSDEAASTLFRFFRSRHFADLRLIFRIAYQLLRISIPLVLIIASASAIEQFFEVEQYYDSCTHGFFPNSGDSCWPHHAARAVQTFFGSLAYLGPIATLCGAAIAWAYQTGGARLGVVDLFACEINTLCRVGTIFDVGGRYVDQYDRPPAPAAAGAHDAGDAGFVSQEQYFPVFENNARDLQALEASVVNNITEFYTYMKAARDSQRRLAAIAPPPSGSPAGAAPVGEADPDPWREALTSLIFLLYLGYEAARKAVDDLVEFDPTRAEHTIVILITELTCYGFLVDRFEREDTRRQRLELRENAYLRKVPDLYRQVMAHDESKIEWLPAKRSAGELARRYRDAFGTEIDAGA